jgi:hypothetical protein
MTVLRQPDRLQVITGVLLRKSNLRGLGKRKRTIEIDPKYKLAIVHILDGGGFDSALYNPYQ